MQLGKSIKIIINYLLGPLLFIILSWNLYHQIIRQPDLPERWMQIRQAWYQPFFWISFGLMFLNWGLEARKWQLLIAPLERLSFIHAFKSILSGCSVTMLTPNRIGEYGGRIIYISPQYRIRAISLTILGSISQLLVTLIIGTSSLIILRFFSTKGVKVFDVLPGLLNDVLIWFSIVITLVMLMAFLRISWIIKIIRRTSYLKKFVKHIEVINVFSGKQLLRILLLSFLRYLVFILQYLLLLDVLQVKIEWELLFCLLSVFYLVMAIAPTIGFIELPVRAAASVELLKLFTSNILGIQAAAFGIWAINLVIPSIAGSLLFLGIKITKEK